MQGFAGQRVSEAQLSILAVHPGALGDVVLFGHLLRRLDGRVTLAAGGEKARLLESLGVVDRALDFDALPMQELFGSTPLEECELPGRPGPHDRLVCCYADGPAGQRLAAACGAATASFLPVRPPEGFGGHLVQLWCDLLGAPFSEEDFREAWTVPEAWRTAAREQLARLGVSGPFMAIHPGAGSQAKRWPVERFVELARIVGPASSAPGPIIKRQSPIANGGSNGPARSRSRLCRRRPVFILGPVELERFAPEELAAIRSAGPVAPCPPLAALAGLLAEAECFLGNDSGASHLAAAVGTPTVALFGPTRAEQFRPLGPCARTLQAESMEEIAVQAVRAAVGD